MELITHLRIDSKSIPSKRVYLDIETVKVEAPESWQYRKRWSAFLLGVGTRDWVVTISGSEDELVRWIQGFSTETTFVYSATRQFDEMVLKGRFTNARRAHASTPGPWAHLEGSWMWENVYKRRLASPLRTPDCESRECPVLWAKGCRDLVRLHCARDVAELMLRDPSLSLDTDTWNALSRFLV